MTPGAGVRPRPVAVVAIVYEMVIAMLGGVLVLGLPAAGALQLAGSSLSELEETAPAVYLPAMGLAMTVPMAAWMRHRGHGWRPTSEMAGAMMVPTIAVIVLLTRYSPMGSFTAVIREAWLGQEGLDTLLALGALGVWVLLGCALARAVFRWEPRSQGR